MFYRVLLNQRLLEAQEKLELLDSPRRSRAVDLILKPWSIVGRLGLLMLMMLVPTAS